MSDGKSKTFEGRTDDPEFLGKCLTEAFDRIKGLEAACEVLCVGMVALMATVEVQAADSTLQVPGHMRSSTKDLLRKAMDQVGENSFILKSMDMICGERPFVPHVVKNESQP